MELSCERCSFKASKLRTSKAKQRLAAHVFASHPKVQEGCHSKDGGTLHSVTGSMFQSVDGNGGTALQSIDEKYGKPSWQAILDGDVPIFEASADYLMKVFLMEMFQWMEMMLLSRWNYHVHFC